MMHLWHASDTSDSDVDTPVPALLSAPRTIPDCTAGGSEVDRPCIGSPVSRFSCSVSRCSREFPQAWHSDWTDLALAAGWIPPTIHDQQGVQTPRTTWEPSASQQDHQHVTATAEQPLLPGLHCFTTSATSIHGPAPVWSTPNIDDTTPHHSHPTAITGSKQQSVPQLSPLMREHPRGAPTSSSEHAVASVHHQHSLPLQAEPSWGSASPSSETTPRGNITVHCVPTPLTDSDTVTLTDISPVGHGSHTHCPTARSNRCSTALHYTPDALPHATLTPKASACGTALQCTHRRQATDDVVISPGHLDQGQLGDPDPTATDGPASKHGSQSLCELEGASHQQAQTVHAGMSAVASECREVIDTSPPSTSSPSSVPDTDSQQTTEPSCTPAPIWADSNNTAEFSCSPPAVSAAKGPLQFVAGPAGGDLPQPPPAKHSWLTCTTSVVMLMLVLSTAALTLDPARPLPARAPHWLNNVRSAWSAVVMSVGTEPDVDSLAPAVWDPHWEETVVGLLSLTAPAAEPASTPGPRNDPSDTTSLGAHIGEVHVWQEPAVVGAARLEQSGGWFAAHATGLLLAAMEDETDNNAQLSDHLEGKIQAVLLGAGGPGQAPQTDSGPDDCHPAVQQQPDGIISGEEEGTSSPPDPSMLQAIQDSGLPHTTEPLLSSADAPSPLVDWGLQQAAPDGGPSESTVSRWSEGTCRHPEPPPSMPAPVLHDPAVPHSLPHSADRGHSSAEMAPLLDPTSWGSDDSDAATGSGSHDAGAALSDATSATVQLASLPQPAVGGGLESNVTHTGVSVHQADISIPVVADTQPAPNEVAPLSVDASDVQTMIVAGIGGVDDTQEMPADGTGTAVQSGPILAASPTQAGNEPCTDADVHQTPGVHTVISLMQPYTGTAVAVVALACLATSITLLVKGLVWSRITTQHDTGTAGSRFQEQQAGVSHSAAVTQQGAPSQALAPPEYRVLRFRAWNQEALEDEG